MQGIASVAMCLFLVRLQPASFFPRSKMQSAAPVSFLRYPTFSLLSPEGNILTFVCPFQFKTQIEDGRNKTAATTKATYVAPIDDSAEDDTEL